MVGIRIRVRTLWRGRLGLGSRVVGRLGSGVWVSASFQFFLFSQRGECHRWRGELSGWGKCTGEYVRRGNVQGKCPTLIGSGKVPLSLGPS